MNSFPILGAVGSLLPPLLVGFVVLMTCLVYKPISESPVTFRTVSFALFGFLGMEIVIAYWAAFTAHWYLQYEPPLLYMLSAWVATISMMVGAFFGIIFVEFMERRRSMDIGLKISAAVFGAMGIVFFVMGHFGEQRPHGWFFSAGVCAVIVFVMFIVGPPKPIRPQK